MELLETQFFGKTKSWRTLISVVHFKNWVPRYLSKDIDSIRWYTWWYSWINSCIPTRVNLVLVCTYRYESATNIATRWPGTGRYWYHNIWNIVYKLVLNFYLKFSSSKSGRSWFSSSARPGWSEHLPRPAAAGCAVVIYSCVHSSTLLVTLV